MRSLKTLALSLGVCLLFGLVYSVGAQQGPGSQSSETVAKPRKKSPDGQPAEPPEGEKIPSKFGKGEAPITFCILIEFSNLYQQYWSYTWYQTLQASYGFRETLKQDDV